MPDVVVTVPQSFGLDQWVAEGDPAGAPWSGQEWHFYLAGSPPLMVPGDRVYVVYKNAIRGYAPLVRIERSASRSAFALVRHGDAAAVTIPETVHGFRGWRYTWWERAAEMPFPMWQDPNATWRQARQAAKHAGGTP